MEITSPVMIRQEDICPKACCEQGKCDITNNFQLESQFIVSESPDAGPVPDRNIIKGEHVNLKVLFKNQSIETFTSKNMTIDEEGEQKITLGPDNYVFFVDLYKRYLVLIRVVYATDRQTVPISLSKV